jgi:hypothetical protein
MLRAVRAGVRIPIRVKKFFSSPKVQIETGGHAAPTKWVLWLFPGSKVASAWSANLQDVWILPDPLYVFMLWTGNVFPLPDTNSGANLFLPLRIETRLLGSQANTEYTTPDTLRQKVMLTLPQALRHTDGADVYRCSFLTSPLEGGERLSSRPGRFTPTQRTRYPLNRRQCGTQSRSGSWGKQKNHFTPPGFELQPVQSVAWSLYWILWQEVNWILRFAVSKVRRSNKAKFSLFICYCPYLFFTDW